MGPRRTAPGRPAALAVKRLNHGLAGTLGSGAAAWRSSKGSAREPRASRSGMFFSLT